MFNDYKCHFINLHRPEVGIALIHWTETAFGRESRSLGSCDSTAHVSVKLPATQQCATNFINTSKILQFFIFQFYFYLFSLLVNMGAQACAGHVCHSKRVGFGRHLCGVSSAFPPWSQWLSSELYPLRHLSVLANFFSNKSKCFRRLL